MMSTIWPLPGEVAWLEGAKQYDSTVLSNASVLWRAGPCVPSMGSSLSLPPLHLSSFSPGMTAWVLHCLGEKCEDACERTLKIWKNVAKMEGTIKRLVSNYWVWQKCYLSVSEDDKLESQTLNTQRLWKIMWPYSPYNAWVLSAASP